MLASLNMSFYLINNFTCQGHQVAEEHPAQTTWAEPTRFISSSLLFLFSSYMYVYVNLPQKRSTRTWFTVKTA